MSTEYLGSSKKHLWECEHGHQWLAKPNTIQQGCWCPFCARTCSDTQRVIHDFVRSLAPDAILNDRTLVRPKEVDIWVPSKGLAIEFNGLYWHSSASPRWKRNTERDKAAAVHATGARFLMIYEDEWRDRRLLVEAMIRHRLGLQSERLAARDLELVRLERNTDWEEFFGRNHIDRSARASWGYGLTKDGRLVAAATVRTNHNRELELARFATDRDLVVAGGAGRLVAAIKRELGSTTLVSYSNNRLSNGSVYKALGFREITRTRAPSYYYTDLQTRVWRYACRRVNDPAVLARFPGVEHTEAAQAAAGMMSEKLFGDRRPLYRIEDCGHRKWVLG